MWAEPCPATFLDCPASLILEFQSTGSESPIALPWGSGGHHLPPASDPLLGLVI